MLVAEEGCEKREVVRFFPSSVEEEAGFFNCGCDNEGNDGEDVGCAPLAAMRETFDVASRKGGGERTEW
jgi:hypothetical protein